jgi:hypothetical protein
MDDFQSVLLLVAILYLTLLYEILDGLKRKELEGTDRRREEHSDFNKTSSLGKGSLELSSKFAGNCVPFKPKANNVPSRGRHVTSRRFVQMRIVSRS